MQPDGTSLAVCDEARTYATRAKRMHRTHCGRVEIVVQAAYVLCWSARTSGVDITAEKCF